MPDGVTMQSMMTYLFPPHLANSSSTGRLDVFAYYGPCDDNGRLPGGPANRGRVHTDLEIKHMINEVAEEQLYTLIARPRATVKTTVMELLPKAVKHSYTPKDIAILFAGISADENGRYKFSDMQRVILADQRRRLLTLIKGGDIVKVARQMIPFQTKPAEVLREITTRKKLRPNEEIEALGKRLNSLSGIVAPLEQQNLANELRNNVVLSMPLGRIDDRWDRYCALRRTGKCSYVGARNMSRARLDDELPDKAPRCSTLVSSMSMNGPLERRC